MNRFSKDMGILDNNMPFATMGLMVCFYLTMSVAVVLCMVNIYMVTLIPILFGLAWWIFKYTIDAYRETTRIESITRSPLLNLLTESFTGASTIRAFFK